MKATGIVRRVDDLGRIVIPKEIRRTLRIREGDPLEEDQRVKVFEIDDAVLYYEFENLMGAKLVENPPALMAVPDCEFSGFRQTEEAFLTCFRELK